MGSVALQLIIIYLIWGLNWVVMKIANLYFAPGLFVALRFTLGAVLLLTLCAMRGKIKPARKDIPWILLSGVLMMGIHNLVVQITTGMLGSGLTAVLDYTMPLWTTLIAAATLGERLTLRKVAGVVLSIVGMVVLMNVGGDINLPAAFATIGAAIIWAVANIIVKRRLKECDPLQYTAWQMSAASVVLWIYTFLRGDLYVVLSTAGIGTLLYNAVLASAIGFLLWNRILAKIEASKASVAVMMVPVVGVIGGVVLLHEALTLRSALGIAAIIAGILVVLTGKSG